MLKSCILISACLLLSSGVASAAITFSVCGTGFTTSACTTQTTPGSADGNWKLMSDPTVNEADGGCTATCAGQDTTPTAAIVTDTGVFPFTGVCNTDCWEPDTTSSEWVSPRAAENGDSDPWSPSVPYVYTETFTIPATVNVTTVIILGEWSADNYGNVFVNGTQITTGVDGAIPNQTLEFTQFTSFTLDGSAVGTENASFHTGSNTLTFEVFNNGSGQPDVTGLDVVITSASGQASPEPASLGFMGLGLAALGFVGRRRRS